MVRRKKVVIGDVFTIAIDNIKTCYGQVIASGIENCYVIYDIVAEKILPLEEVVIAPIVFLAFTSNN